jgi:hypothetical protein
MQPLRRGIEAGQTHQGPTDIFNPFQRKLS